MVQVVHPVPLSQVEFCKSMGNVKGNRFWEARLPASFRRPPSGTPNPELATFIRDKYVERRYAATDVTDPPNIENYLQHPYARDEAGNPPAVDASVQGSATSTPPAGGNGPAVQQQHNLLPPFPAGPNRPFFPPVVTNPILAPVRAGRLNDTAHFLYGKWKAF